MTDPIVRCEYCNNPAIGYAPCRDQDHFSMIGIFVIPPLLEAVCEKCIKRVADHWEKMNRNHGK